MKTSAEKKFENLQKALDFLSESNWEAILNTFGLNKYLNMENTIVNLKIKSIDGKECTVNLTVKFP